MKDSANILITCAGRRVELTRAFTRAAAHFAPVPRIFCGDCDATAPALAFCDGAITLPGLSDPPFATRLAEACAQNAIGLVVPTIDTELPLLASLRDRFLNDFGVRIVVSSPELVNACCDKAATAQFFAKFGLPAPKTFSSAEEALAIPDGDYPLMVKPRFGNSSKNAFAVHSRRELEFFLDYVEQPIVQELLDGDEYSIDAFFGFDSRPVAAVPRHRIAVRAGEILKGRVEMNPVVMVAAENALAALADCGAVGPATLQGFLCGDGAFRFTEINPRFGGGAPMSIAAGANFPAWLMALARNLPLEPFFIRDGATFSRFDDSIELQRGAEES